MSKSKLESLATEWEGRAREYRKQTETLLPNRAGNREGESLLWRARAYETCAEELRAALERPRPALREAIHPISEAAQKVVEAYESGIIANRDAAVNDLREMLARPAPPATEPPMQCRHGAITQCRSCAGERADEIMERLAHR